MSAVLVWVAWADIVLCAIGRVLSIAAPLALMLWVVMICHGR